MEISKTFNNFLNSICDNIKYSPVRKSVKIELYEHLLEDREHYISSGLTNEEAEKMAIDNLGNPNEISSNFNKIYKRQLDWKLLIIFISLIIINMLLTFSVATTKNFDAKYTVRNVSYIISGIVISILLYFFNYQNLNKKYFTFRNWNCWYFSWNCQCIFTR